MDQLVFNPIEMGKGISEFGFMIMCSALFLITSVSLMFLIIKLFTRLLYTIIGGYKQSIDEILSLERQQLEILRELRTKN